MEELRRSSVSLNSNIITGPAIEPYIIPYRMHDNIERQLAWKEGLAVNKH